MLAGLVRSRRLLLVRILMDSAGVFLLLQLGDKLELKEGRMSRHRRPRHLLRA